jgi:hypothetical protein
MNITLEQAKDLAAIIATVVGVITFAKGVIEYVHQGAQKRAEQFVAMSKRLNEDVFKQICDLLENDDPKLAEISNKDKIEFLGLYEEVALMMNSKMIRPAVAHYMFGYYAILCSESKNFWINEDRSSPYWTLFNNFVERMKEERSCFNCCPSKLRF